jgi:hypothetical protein
MDETITIEVYKLHLTNGNILYSTGNKSYRLLFTGLQLSLQQLSKKHNQFFLYKKLIVTPTCAIFIRKLVNESDFCLDEWKNLTQEEKNFIYYVLRKFKVYHSKIEYNHCKEGTHLINDLHSVFNNFYNLRNYEGSEDLKDYINRAFIILDELKVRHLMPKNTISNYKKKIYSITENKNFDYQMSKFTSI